MSDGIWSSGPNVEDAPQSGLIKHRLLRINLSSAGLLNPGDASSLGEVEPALFPGDPSAGPHFVMSPRTPDQSKTFGAEFALFPPSTNFATAPFDVTVWVLIGTSTIVSQPAPPTPLWANMVTISALPYQQLVSTFDINAEALRFQIVDAGVAASNRSVIIAFSEL